MKKLKKTFLFFFSFLLPVIALTQPAIEWEKTYGPSSVWSHGSSVIEMSAGGYVFATWGGSSCYGSADIWIYRVDEQGEVVWSNCYGGGSNEYPATWESTLALVETHEGGVLFGCRTGSGASGSGQVEGPSYGLEDWWLVKVDPNGSLVWAKCFGGPNHDLGPTSITLANDGSYVVAGTVGGSGGQISGSFTGTNFWLIKISGEGDLIWQRCLGGSGFDRAYSVTKSVDSQGGFVIAGSVHSNNGGLVSGKRGGIDFWVTKVSESGTSNWRRCFGGSADDIAMSIIPSSDNKGYIVTGRTRSNNFDVTGNSGGWDALVIKIDTLGNLIWSKCIGDIHANAGTSAVASHNGDGYLILGSSTSNSAQNNGTWYNAWSNTWITKISQSGEFVWQTEFGSPSTSDTPSHLVSTSDGGYLFIGSNFMSFGADGLGTQTSFSKIWAVKLAEIGDPLPVDLLSFGAEAVDLGVKITWRVPSESDHVRFEVLRGKDPSDMTVIDRLDATIAPVTVTYEVYDSYPFEGVSYYQLLQVYQDGTTKLTHIVPVFKQSRDHFFQEIDTVGLRGERSRVVDTLGRLGQWKLVHNIGTLPSGTYLIQGEDSGRTFKFFKP